MRPASMIAVLTGLAVTSEAPGGDTVDFTMRTVAMIGDAAPGAPGAQFSEFIEPVINAIGDVCFVAKLSGPDVTNSNDEGLWAHRNGELALIAREGDLAPGTNGLVFRFFEERPRAINANGDLAFGAFLNEPGMNSNFSTSVWMATAAGLELVAMRGDDAPGTQGLTFSSISNPALNNAGELVCFGSVATQTSQPFDPVGIWSGAPNDLQLVARAGDPAPGTKGVFRSITFHILGLQIDSEGRTVFDAQSYDLAAGEVLSVGVWRGAPGDLDLIVEAGDSVPGTDGAPLQNVQDPLIGNGSIMTFAGSFPGNFGNFGNDNGIWRVAGAGLDPVVVSGDAAPIGSFNTSFTGAFPFVIDANGRGVFRGHLGDAAPGLKMGVFSDQSGEVKTLYFDLGPAPGTNAFFRFPKSILDPMPAINSKGQSVLASQMIGPQVDGTNYRGMWLVQPNSGLKLALRLGQTILAPNSEGGAASRILKDFSFVFGSSHDNGLAGGFNDRSELVTCMRFTDDSGGVFVLQLPGPCLYDFDANGVVDGADLQNLLSKWGASSAAVVGPIGGHELAELLGTWGPCE